MSYITGGGLAWRIYISKRSGVHPETRLSHHEIGLQGFGVSSWWGSLPWTWQDKGGRLDARDGRGCACAFGRGSPSPRRAVYISTTLTSTRYDRNNSGTPEKVINTSFPSTQLTPSYPSPLRIAIWLRH